MRNRARPTLGAALMTLGLYACSSDTPTDDSPDAGATPAADAGAAAPAPDAGLAEGPIPLTPQICDDPSLVRELANSVGGGGPLDGPSFGEVNAELLMRLLQSPTEGPFYMVNLIRFRERALYPDGRASDLTGREANDLYSPLEFLAAIGARVVFTGDVGQVLLGDTAWDQVAIVEYPCPLAFVAMSADPGFQARSIHKEAGVEESIVMVTRLLPSALPEGFTPPESPFPATAEDPAFEMIHVLRYRDEAEYGPDAQEPARTGREAMDLYTTTASQAAQRVGVYPTAWFEVEGVLIGDGRPWDEVRLNRMPSLAGFESLAMDPTRQAGAYHREAALADTYAIVTYPVLSAIPGAPGQTGGQGPQIAPDGTGTPCQTDADCPGGGVDTCLNPEGNGGFCTREGCGAGECAGGFVCCRDCSPAVASFLPFTDSACFPAQAAGMLSNPPAACTCD